MIRIITFFFLTGIISCNIEAVDLALVRSSNWQYDNGFKIGEGDFLSFDEGSKVFALRGDTIWYKGQPCALIKKMNKKNNELVVESLDKKEKGIYINMEEFLK